ncbi:MAG: ParB/RepB/Spo0J family partition protein [Planctomycetota bacterium]|jgi:ParB family chromosome partitioning protein
MQTQKKEKPRHLGRGLQSLLGPITIETSAVKQSPATCVDNLNLRTNKQLRETLCYIQLSQITPNPYQPRTTWDPQDLEDLAASMKTNGLLQPIIVRPAQAGHYQLIAGERRFRAAQLASLNTIPAMIRSATDEQMLELALIENIHRTNLNPIERATAYKNYLGTFDLTQSEVAKRLGENRSVVANYLRLLELPDDIKQMLIENQLSMGHARAILALPTDQLRRKLANRAMAGRLSVREVERLVQNHLAAAGQSRPASRVKSAHIIDLENRIGNKLGTKVTIQTRRNAQKGKIIIEFFSLEEFDRITESIGLTALEEV